MFKHHSALGLATALRPVQPVTLLRPHAAKRAARFFAEKFPGKSLYAVKANPSPDLLRVLWDAGVTHYDVASLGEVRLVAETLPEAVLCFMHPVKAEEAIAEAYFDYGVKTFSLDTLEELEKIVRATSKDGVAATDLNLLVRLQVNNEHAKTQPRRQVRRAGRGREGSALRGAPGVRRARHLLPCGEPGHVACSLR